MREKIFYSATLGFALGVLLRSYFAIDSYFLLVLVFIGVVVLGYFFISKNAWVLVFSLFVLTLSLGVLRFAGADKVPTQFENLVGQETELSGTLVRQPDWRENNQKLQVELENSSQQVSVLVTTDFTQTFEYGDKVKFTGELEKPENFLTDTGKEFDYINYLRKDGVYYLVNYPEVEVISSGHGSAIKSALFSVKDAFVNNINSVVKSPESLLLSGLILGERGEFGRELTQDFIDTGTIHIVALSGYNVTIIAEWIIKAFQFLPFLAGIGAGIMAILLFVLMTGAPATAVRAGVMAVLALIARATGRNYAVARALVLAGVIMILINPLVLRYDASFQLSFMATVAVIFLAPRFMKHFKWVTPQWGLRDIFAVTTAAYLFVLPFILYQMGNFSLVALPANVLILPLIPVTMIFGFATGILGLVWHGLSEPFGFFAQILLGYELEVVDILSGFSFSAFTIPNFPLILTLIIYAFLLYYLFGKRVKLFFKN